MSEIIVKDLLLTFWRKFTDKRIAEITRHPSHRNTSKITLLHQSLVMWAVVWRRRRSRPRNIDIS